MPNNSSCCQVRCTWQARPLREPTLPHPHAAPSHDTGRHQCWRRATRAALVDKLASARTYGAYIAGVDGARPRLAGLIFAFDSDCHRHGVVLRGHTCVFDPTVVCAEIGAFLLTFAKEQPRTAASGAALQTCVFVGPYINDGTTAGELAHQAARF